MNKISIYIKILISIFIAILIPVYWQNYGSTNFLWISDISLFLTFFALWLESSLLFSIALIMAFPVELAWNIDFFYQLFTGKTIIDFASYMFDAKYSLFLRCLSLFHIFMPIVWIRYISKLKYNKKAIYYSIPLNS